MIAQRLTEQAGERDSDRRVAYGVENVYESGNCEKLGGF